MAAAEPIDGPFQQIRATNRIDGTLQRLLSHLLLEQRPLHVHTFRHWRLQHLLHDRRRIDAFQLAIHIEAFSIQFGQSVRMICVGQWARIAVQCA